MEMHSRMRGSDGRAHERQERNEHELELHGEGFFVWGE